MVTNKMVHIGLTSWRLSLSIWGCSMRVMMSGLETLETLNIPGATRLFPHCNLHTGTSLGQLWAPNHSIEKSSIDIRPVWQCGQYQDNERGHWGRQGLLCRLLSWQRPENYGMAHRERDFYADNVYKSVSLAPCFVKNDYTFAKNEKSFDSSLM